MRDDDIHAGEFEELENVMEQRLAAVDDDFQAQPLDVRAGIAGAGGRLAQLRDLFAEQAEKREQLRADKPLCFTPRNEAVLFPAVEEYRVAFQLGNLQGQFDLFYD